MSLTKFTNVERTAIWNVYNHICFFCNKALHWDNLNIDHIIPETLENDSNKKTALFEEYNLSSDFDINGYHNLVPAHNYCNLRKSGDLFSKGTTLYYLELAAKKVPQVVAEIKRIKESSKKGIYKSRLVTGIEQGIIPKDELLDLLVRIDVLPQESNNLSEYIEDLAMLMDKHQYKAAISVLDVFKDKNWENITDDLKYTVTLNLGIAYFNLNNKQKGAKYFIELLNYQSVNSKALGYVALGYSLINNAEVAEKYAKLAIQENPDNEQAYLSLLFIQEDELTPDQIDKLIPKAIQGKPSIALNIGILLDRFGHYDQAFEIYQNLEKTYNSNDPLKYDIWGQLAFNRINSLSSQGAYWYGQFDQISKSKIDYAIEKLDTAWIFFKGTDQAASRWYIVMNRGVLKNLLGLKDSAEDDFKEALNYHKDYLIYRHLLINNLQDKVKANNFLKEIENLVVTNEQKQELILLKTQVDIFSGALTEELISNLFKQTEDIIDQETKLKWLDTIIELLIFNKSFDKATIATKKLIELAPNITRGYYYKSKILHLTNSDKKEILNYLDVAIQKLNETTKMVFVMDIFNLLNSIQEYKKAADILVIYTDISQYTQLSHNLLIAYYKAGNVKRGLEIAEPLLANNQNNEFLLEYLSGLYSLNKNYDLAIKTLEHQLSLSPNDKTALFNLAIVFTKTAEFENAARMADRILEYDELSVERQFMLANIYMQAGQTKKGIDLSIEIRKRNYNEIKTHHLFLSTIMAPRPTDQYSKEPNTVTIPCHVILLSKSGKQIEKTIVDKAETPTEIDSKSKLASQLFNKNIGDEIELGAETYFIKEIQSIATYAFRDSIIQIQIEYGNEGPFREGKFVENSSSEEMFNEIEKQIQPFLKKAKEIENYYKQGLLTISHAAQILNLTPINFWEKLSASPELGIFSVGIQDEAITCYSELDKGKPFILDIISIITLFHTNTLQILDYFLGKVHVAKSTMEILTSELKQLEKVKGSLVTHTDRIDGKIQTRIETPEETEKKYQRLFSFLENLSKKTIITSATPSEDYNIKIQKDNLLGESTNETQEIASKSDYLLCSDDSRFRDLSKHQQNLIGCSVFILHNYLYRKNKINIEELLTFFHSLIKLNYRNIPMTADLLHTICSEGLYNVQQPFINSCDALSCYMNNDEGVVTLVGNFFYILIKANPLIQKRKAIIHFVLSKTLKDRSISKMKFLFKSYLKRKFSLLPLEYAEIRRELDTFF